MLEDTYLLESIEADPDAVHAETMGRLRELLPGFEERATGLVELVSQARAAQDAVLIDFASDVLASIVAEVARVAGVARNLPQPLVGTATVTTDGAETYLLPAGATFVAYLPDQSAVSLFVTVPATIDAGETSVSGVQVQSVQDAQFVGLATPQPLEPDQAYGWLVEVTLDAVVSIGSDGDGDDEYLDRSSRSLRRLAEQLIRPEDVAAYVRDVDGVGRSLVLDLVDATSPASPVSPVERCMTVVVTGPDGSAPTTGLLSLVKAGLQARREVNFKFFTVPPTYVPIDLELTVAVWPDSLEGIAADVEEQLRGWLSPAQWGARERIGEWEPSTTVRIGDVVSVADNVAGVDYVDPSLVLLDGVNADFGMEAPIAALPDPLNTTVTVNVVERQP
jgi:hypothetical protein